MTNAISSIAFGPVPSRRLGQSLGINNIPPKKCSYSCVYCQLGRTYDVQIIRTPFYEPQEIFDAVEQKIQAAKQKKESIDYLTFVADGEPTLDRNIGEEIKMLKSLGLKIAVITNSSLLWINDVKDDLYNADWVSLKIDTIDQGTWRRINRPLRSLQLGEILQGIRDFSDSFPGILTTETMLLQDVNDATEQQAMVAKFIGSIQSDKSYLSIPTRPPAENWVKPAKEKNLNNAFQIFSEQGIDVEYLIGYEGNRFASTGDIIEDLLSIMSVHPLREDGLKAVLSKADASWDLITTLLDQKKIIQTDYKGKKFFIRTLPKKASDSRNESLQPNDSTGGDSK